MRRRLMLRNESGGGILPPEYQQVEWIASSGTQVINTGIIPDNNTIIRAAFEKPSTAGVNIFGSCSSAYNIDTFLLSYNLSGNHQMFICYVGGNVNTNGNTSIQVNQINNFIVSMDSKKIVIGNADTQEEVTYQYSRTYAGFTGNNPIAIFARNQNDGYRAFSSYKLRSFQIENSGVLQRDFISCYRKSGGAIGLFDTVSQTFFTNVGSGTFTKGADVN